MIWLKNSAIGLLLLSSQHEQRGCKYQLWVMLNLWLASWICHQKIRRILNLEMIHKIIWINMNIGALIFRRPHQINVVRKIEDDSNSTTTMCECPFFSEVNLIADYLCTFKDRLESLVCDTNCVTRHHNFRIFKSLFLEDI